MQILKIIDDESNGVKITLNDGNMFIEPVDSIKQLNFFRYRLVDLQVSFISAKIRFQDKDVYTIFVSGKELNEKGEIFSTRERKLQELTDFDT